MCDEWLSPKEFAALWQVSERTAHAWAQGGKYGVQRVGGRWRFPAHAKPQEPQKPQHPGNTKQRSHSPAYA